MTLRSSIASGTDTMQLGAPAAEGTAVTLTYNPNTDTATITQSGSFSDNGTITNALPLTFSFAGRAGVLSFGGGKFESLTATGSGIPNLDSTGTCEAEGEGEGGGGGTEGEGESAEEPPAIGITGAGFVEAGTELVLGLSGAETAVGFQWSKDGVNLSGETGDTLDLTPVEESDAGVYRCAVDTGAKAIVLTPKVVVTVVAPGQLPALGGPGLVLLGVALAGGLALGSRKK